MHLQRPETATLEGPNQVRLAAPAATAVLRGHALLRGLLATGAGVFSRHAGHLRRGRTHSSEAVFLYCLKGGGWCELAGHLHTVRKGDFLVIPGGATFACSAHASNPWTIHWVQASGEHLLAYLGHLAVSVEAPAVPGGEDLQLVRLLNEILKSLQRGPDFVHLLRASQTLAHLIATLIDQPRQRSRSSPDTVQKIAESIIYMSDHLDEPLRVTALARMANLSADYFGELC